MQDAMNLTRASMVVGALLLSALLVGLGVMSFHHETAKSRPVVVPFEMFWCAKDDDCAVVSKIGCCSCREGGAQAAVTRWRQDDLRRFPKKACRPAQVCVQTNLCRAEVEARCIKRRCTLVTAHDEQE